MMELDRGQIVKALECCCINQMCDGCPMFDKEPVADCSYYVMSCALAIIKELTEEIRDLEEEYERVYEQAEADIRGNMADGGTSCHWCIAGHRADVVKKMQDRMVMHFGTYTDKTEVKVVDVFKLMGQVAEEMLEENNV